MESLKPLYQSHIAVLQSRAQQVLTRFKLDAMLIHSGELLTVFMDDHDYPFKVNPLFKAWVPVTSVPNCWLWVDGVSKPKLWFWSPVDYWHKVEPLPHGFWTDEIEIFALKDADDIAQLLPAQRDNVACITPVPGRADRLGFNPAGVNPQGVIDFLHYHRAYKTDYELSCMREAQKLAVAGHRAAKEAFLSGLSEFDINLAYLTATGHRDTDLPYSNIIALNEHAAVLHYTQLEAQPPAETLSFLIDAGAEYLGYAADLTRSYAAQGNTLYAQMVAAMNQEELALIETLQAGVRYTDYHLQMHQRIARLLLKFDLVSGLSEEALVAENLTGPFMPHGLGHPLGLQVHDVAGFMQDDSGTQLSAPAQYPFLRCTRVLEPGMVLTIEPGLYIIDSLLEPWRQGKFSQHFNWQAIDSLKPFGGIRIEDNVIIHAGRIENMTRGPESGLMNAYDIPAESLSISEETIKKSRFITLLAHTEGAVQARQFVQQIRHQHPSARHHCWAWVAGAPDDSQQYGFSDDGEPSGTAGKPMLAQLMGSQVGEITAVVVRYYGGIQLGTGGLVKAYGGGVQSGLKQLTRRRKVPMRLYQLQCDYARLADIERLLQRAGGEVRQSDFSQHVLLTLALPCSQTDTIALQLSDMSRGALALIPLQQ